MAEWFLNNGYTIAASTHLERSSGVVSPPNPPRSLPAKAKPERPKDAN